jgi:hypothetical protein
MKQIIKYIVTFISLATVLTTLLVLSANISKSYIIENLQESAEYLKTKTGIQKKVSAREYTYLHTYADSVILNIIFCTDENASLKSVVESKFYQWSMRDSTTDFVTAVQNNLERKRRIRKVLAWLNNYNKTAFNLF